MSIKYKVVSEWAAPTYYDIDTNEELYNECDASIQALWVVSYDEDEHEIIEWLERFATYEDSKAVDLANELNEKGE